MNAPITLPEISPSEAQHPAVVKLLEVLHQQVLIIQQQSETIHGLQDELQRLKDEIAHLKQHKSKPKIRPSQLGRPAPKDPSSSAGKRAGSEKRRKTEQLEIYETTPLKVGLSD